MLRCAGKWNEALLFCKPKKMGARSARARSVANYPLITTSLTTYEYKWIFRRPVRAEQKWRPRHMGKLGHQLCTLHRKLGVPLRPASYPVFRSP